ncbi:MAG: flagellin, partial [Candidatus Eremiobacteraeota bacterium]|nr:flagellin [Candidatus Eremiobacteraeota bacterium]
MRSLVVEANSSINSAGDIANIQAELNQLELEINRIASNANYNGKTLFDGSLTSQPPNLTNQILFIENPNTDGGNGTTPPASPPSGPPLITADPTYTQANPNSVPLDFSLSVNSFDPTSDTLDVTFTAQSSDPSFGPPQTVDIQVAENTDYPNGFPGPAPGPLNQYTVFDQNGNPVFSFAFNNVNRNDVGKTAVLATITPQNYQPGSGLNVNVGTAEGNTVTVQIGALSTFNLGISELQAGDQLTNQASEGRLDNALEEINTMRAQLGAQQVSLNYATDDAATQEVNQIASESSIRDLNIGSTVTAFTKEQILVNVGTSVLSQMEVNATSLTNVLISGLAG